MATKKKSAKRGKAVAQSAAKKAGTPAIKTGKGPGVSLPGVGGEVTSGTPPFSPQLPPVTGPGTTGVNIGRQTFKP
ncbi:MAG: hypothetical protein ABI119_03380 [Gemmatimonadaceae bacterium]